MKPHYGRDQKKPQGLHFSVPLVLGAITVIVAWGLYRLLYPPIDPQVKAVADQAGVEPEDILDIRHILAQAAKGTPLSVREWDRFTELKKSHSAELRQLAMIVASTFRDPFQRSEGIASLYVALADSSTSVRATAVTGLALQHAPRWKEVAAKYRDSPDETVRQAARVALERFGKSNEKDK